MQFCKKYIYDKPFISFDDIFESHSTEETKKIEYIMKNNILNSEKLKHKCFLLYGPKGCGKTLSVHALAKDLGARIAQIDGLELFKIQFFAREFVRACLSCFLGNQNRPLIIFMRNIDQMIPSINNFNYIYDKISSNYQKNLYFFASSNTCVYNLNKKIKDKFKFFQLFKPVHNNDKVEYIRFIGSKIGIEIKMNDEQLKDFTIKNLTNFSNEDIFDLIKLAIRHKKKNSPSNDENWAYRDGLNEEDIRTVFCDIRGSLTPAIMISYYL